MPKEMMTAVRWLFGVTWGKEEERKEASLPEQEAGNTPQQEGRRRKRKKEPTERKREDDRGEEVDFGDKKMTEAQYLRKRRFRFLHYYAGTEDPLGKALRAEAEKHNMKITVVSCEKEGPDGVDLLKEEPFNEHCQLAKEGRWDGFHSGFPCTSYSRLRWRPSGSYPGPCRSKEHPYGLPTNLEKLQRECDEGTLHAARSALIGRYILWEREDHTVRPVVTLENPPPSELENHLLAWELGEVKELVEGFNFVSANFTSCKFQMDIPRGERYYKPQRISGTLRGLTSLSGGCPCGRGAVHVPVVGKDVSQASGKYPQALCEAYASLVIEHFKKMASEEFVRRRARVMEEELTRLRDIKRKKESQAESAKAAFDTTVGQRAEGQESTKEENKQPTKEEISSEEESVPEEVMKCVGKELPGTTAERRSRSRTPLRRKRTETGPKEEAKEADTSKAKSGNPASSSRGSQVRGTTPKEQSEEAGQAHSLEWKGGTGAYGMLKGSKAKAEDPARLDFLGGMRNPAEVVKGMPNGQALGEEVYRAWQAYVRKDKRALKAAETYGTPECILDPNTVGSWRAELRRLTESKGKQSAVLKQKYEYRSPLVGDIVEAWTRKARDPDTPLTRWIADGVPLGINLPIEMTGVFPKAEKDQEAEIQTDALQQMSRGDIANYTSVLENMEDAKIEVDRLVAKKIALRVSKAEVEQHFSQGTISRLALIVKERPDHTKKRRLIIDLKRSGGNSKASLPERLILPRAQDVMSTAKELRRLQPEEASEQADWAREMVLVDVSDAFPHLGVHGRELEHCLAPDIEGSGYLLFRALLFGYKTAPLLWSRLAAWVARLLQSCIPLHVGQHQVYLDDSCWMLQGTLRERTTALAFIIYTMAALGLEVSIKKGERGAQVAWAGLHFRLPGRDAAHSPGEVLGRPPDHTGELGIQRDGTHKRTTVHHWKDQLASRSPAQDPVVGSDLLRGADGPRGRTQNRRGGETPPRADRQQSQGVPLPRKKVGTSQAHAVADPGHGPRETYQESQPEKASNSQSHYPDGCVSGRTGSRPDSEWQGTRSTGLPCDGRRCTGLTVCTRRILITGDRRSTGGCVRSLPLGRQTGGLERGPDVPGRLRHGTCSSPQEVSRQPHTELLGSDAEHLLREIPHRADHAAACAGSRQQSRRLFVATVILVYGEPAI